MYTTYRVTASKNKDYNVGDLVINSGGWCSHVIADSSTERIGKLDASIPPEKSSLALGVLGMPG